MKQKKTKLKDGGDALERIDPIMFVLYRFVLQKVCQNKKNKKQRVLETFLREGESARGHSQKTLS